MVTDGNRTVTKTLNTVGKQAEITQIFVTEKIIFIFFQFLSEVNKLFIVYP